MSVQVTAEQVREVLTSLAEEFLVDIPAAHDGKGGYFLEYNQLAGSLIISDEAWYEAIAAYTNEKDEAS